MIAKENCVGTFKIAFGGGSMAHFQAQLQQAYAPMAGYAFLVFNLLCAPCFAAIGTMYKEFGDTRWTWYAVGYQSLVAYLIATIVNQIGALVAGAATLWGLGLASVALVLILFGLFVKRPTAGNLQNAI